MKKLLLLSFSMFAMLWVSAQNAPTKIISGNITSNRFFSKDTVYILNGFVFVKNNATLTIEKGTVIRGIKATRSTLIITMGSRIVANGTKAEPIVFTSNESPNNRAPGDWGGLVILGRNIINRTADCTTCPGAAVAASLPGAQVNIEGDIDNEFGDGLYGGTLTDDDSGVLRYVRIEFAGVVITPGNESNSLTMGGVGSGTTIEYVQCSYGNDDAFEWFGGNVDAKYLISIGTIDDDLDVDFGYTGRVQFAIVQRDSFNYDAGTGPTTNGWESDNDNPQTFNNPRTAPVFSNITVIGPNPTTAPNEEPGSFQNAARLRRNSLTSIFNSVIIGFPDGIFLDGAGSTNAYLNDTLLLKNNIVTGQVNRRMFTNQAANSLAVRTKFASQGNDTSAVSTSLLVNPFDYGNPNFFPTPGSPALSGASFQGALISDPFFTPTTYRGALGTDGDWTECWSEFDPQLPAYNRPTYKGATAIFTATATGGQISTTNSSTQANSFIWTLNGAQQQTGQTASFTVNQSGQYTVQLIAVNPCQNDTATQLVDISVGINNISDLAQLVMAPNPANDLVIFSFDMINASELSLNMIDINGRLVAERSFGKVAAGKQQFELNTSALPSGIYFVRLNTSNGFSTHRVVVSH